MGELSLITRALKFCEERKYRFTEPRQRVLSLLADSNQPMGAYQILALLSSSKVKVKPPTVYRAIEFWNKHGFIHRIESMNAYIACCEKKKHQNFCIFICNDCSNVQEMEMSDLPTPMASGITKKHLTVTSTTTEIRGTCGECN